MLGRSLQAAAVPADQQFDLSNCARLNILSVKPSSSDAEDIEGEVELSHLFINMELVRIEPPCMFLTTLAAVAAMAMAAPAWPTHNVNTAAATGT